MNKNTSEWVTLEDDITTLNLVATRKYIFLDILQSKTVKFCQKKQCMDISND